MLAGPGVDPLYPERPEVPFALLAPGVGVNPAFPYLLFGSLVRALLRSPVALGLLKDLLALLTGMEAACRTSHLAYSQQTLNALLVRRVHRRLGIQAPLALGALLLQDVIVAAPAALDPALFRNLEAPRGALVRLHLRHTSPPRFPVRLCIEARGTGVAGSPHKLAIAIVAKGYVICGRRSPEARSWPRPSRQRPFSG